MNTPETLSSLPPPPSRRWLRVLLLALVFLAGMASGGGLTAFGIVRAVREIALHPEARPARATTFLKRRLDLTPEQQARVRAILDRQAQELQSLRAEVWPRVLARLERTEGEIAEVLTPPQQEKWKELAARLRKDWLAPPPSPSQP